MTDIGALLAELKRAGGDNARIEVKAAAGGLPESVTPSLGALANLPGGGVIILGLDEKAGFTPVRLADPNTLKQGLGAKARSFTPPISLTIEDADVAGSPVIIATVAECPVASKPCTHSSGKAWIRSYDGNFELSDVERQAFLIGRTHPTFDRQPVPRSSRDDLDPDLVTSWMRAVRRMDPEGLGRFDDDQILWRGGVLLRSGELTVAGLLALGAYPQQYFPRWVIQTASVPAHPGSGVRATGLKTISGPIPRMLAGAMKWAESALQAVTVVGEDGNSRNDLEYPRNAIRELLSNALVHRDLADWSQGLAIEVRHRSDQLVVQNPGGLFGITVDRLGDNGVTSARNSLLISICQFVEVPEDTTRVVEALAQGIPIISASLRARGMPPAQFTDQGIRFSVILRRRPPSASVALRGASLRHVYALLGAQPLTVAEVVTASHLNEGNVRRILSDLARRQLIAAEPQPNGLLGYRRAAD